HGSGWLPSDEEAARGQATCRCGVRRQRSGGDWRDEGDLGGRAPCTGGYRRRRRRRHRARRPLARALVDRQLVARSARQGSGKAAARSHWAKSIVREISVRGDPAAAHRTEIKRRSGDVMRAFVLVRALAALGAASGSITVIENDVALPVTVASPNSAIKFDLSLRSENRLSYRVTLNGRPAIELSRTGI